MGTAKMQSERMILPWSKSIVFVINPPSIVSAIVPVKQEVF